MLNGLESINEIAGRIWVKAGGVRGEDLREMTQDGLISAEEEQTNRCYVNSLGFLKRAILTLFFIITNDLYAKDIKFILSSGELPEDMRVFLWGLSAVFAYGSFAGAFSNSVNTIISAVNTEKIKREIQRNSSCQ